LGFEEVDPCFTHQNEHFDEQELIVIQLLGGEMWVNLFVAGIFVLLLFFLELLFLLVLYFFSFDLALSLPHLGFLHLFDDFGLAWGSICLFRLGFILAFFAHSQHEVQALEELRVLLKMLPRE